MTENGAVVSVPMAVVPSKNCTLAIDSSSAAVASSVIGTPTTPVLPPAGGVSETAGGWLVAGPASMNVAVNVRALAGVAIVCVAAPPSLQLLNW